MLYEEHAALVRKRRDAAHTLNRLIDERSVMFQMTQGGGDGEPVKSSPKNDKFDNYLVALEKSGIDEKIQEAQTIFNLWDSRCKDTELELRQSRILFDQIYLRRWIDGKGTRRIANELHYSRRQIERHVKKMSQNVAKAML